MNLIECGFFQRDATNLNSSILAKDIKNSMTAIHTYLESANGSSHNAVYHKFYCALQSTCPYGSVKKIFHFNLLELEFYI